MPQQTKTLDELMAEYEPERQAALARDLAAYDSPEAVAKRAARRAAEDDQIAREIAAGTRNPDGSPIEDIEDDEDDDDD
jgi:hypothetical protein